MKRSNFFLFVALYLLISFNLFPEKFVLIDDFETHNWHSTEWGEVDDTSSIHFMWITLE